MDKRFKNHVLQLSKLLIKNSLQYMNDNLDETENLNDVASFILGAYLTSLHNCLRSSCQNDKKAIDATEKFMIDLSNYIANRNCIAALEITKAKKEE